MKLFGVVFLAMFTASGQSQGSALEEKVRALFLQEEGDTFTDLRLKLLQLGGENEVAAVLTRFANTYKHAAERSLEFVVLGSSVACLGELKAGSANELLSSFLTDPKVHENVRARAARALGQIDPEANKQALLKALDPTGYLMIRVYAAEGLAQTRDPEALKALERFGLEEKDTYVRQEFVRAAQALRAKGVKPN